MTLLPKTRKRRLFSLVTGITLILSVAYTVVFQPMWIRFSNYSLHFAYLEVTKKLISEGMAGDCRVYLYGEDSNGQTAEVKNLELLAPTIAEAFSDFPDFVVKRHKINLPKVKIDYLKITLVTEKTYDSYRRTSETLDRLDSNAFNYKHNIYIESKEQKFDILLDKTILRHEVFHFLSYKYGLYNDSNSFLPHSDAYEFGSLLKVKK